MNTVGNLEVKVVTPEKTIFEGSVDYVSLPAKEGVLGIYKRHIPLLTLIDQGEVTIVKNGQKEFIAIFGGFAEVGPDHVTILTDAASRSEELDEVKIREAKKRAEEKLSEKLSQQDYLNVQAELRKAILGLKVANRRRRSNLLS